MVGVLAAAHSIPTPNNLYSALESDAEPITLPLAVISEKGKHALAPDVNRDLKFTPGLDVDVTSEYSEIWGVRDAIGQSDAHMLAYESSMTLPRKWSDAWAEKHFASYFDISSFPGLQQTYDLVDFPGSRTAVSTSRVISASASTALDVPRSTTQPSGGLTSYHLMPVNMTMTGSTATASPAVSRPVATPVGFACPPWPKVKDKDYPEREYTEAYANYLLSSHTDCRKPQSIYKTYVFPFRALRLGVGNVDGGPVIPGGSSIFSIAYVNDLTHLPLLEKVLKSPLPGRIAFEFMGGTTYDYASVYTYLPPSSFPSGCFPLACPPVLTYYSLRQDGHRLYFGGQYEHPLTNLFGYYVGYLKRITSLSSPSCPSHLNLPCTQLKALNLIKNAAATGEDVGIAGVYFDFPKLRNLTLEVGPAFVANAYGSLSPNIGYRLSVNIWQWRGRDSFGNAPTR